MVLINLQGIRVEVKDRTLFHIKDLSIHQGDRIGLVGRNGSGKTSLLQVIAKEREPAAGVVTQRASVALLPQLKPQIDQKSGGEISQAVIHETFSQEADVLLADEPTTHLDMENVEKLEQQLKRRQEAMVVVSHDRAFLDALCNQIWELDDEQIRVYSGNYTEYEQQKEAARKHHEKEYEKYIHKKKQLEEAMEQKDQKAQRAVKKPKNLSGSEAKAAKFAKPYFAKKQKKLNQGVKSIQTRIDQLDKVEKIKELPPIKMEVAHEASLNKRTIIRGEKVSGTVGDRLLWQAFDFSVAGGDKVALIGPNGSGKTTFLHMILGGAQGIHISPSVSFGYFSQMLEVLDVNDSILDNVSSTSSQDPTLIRTVLARLGFFREDVFKPVHVLSGGERVKVAFAKLFVSDANVLILDEPTNYLDIEAVEELGSLLHDYSGTVMLVSHDRRLLEHVATKVFAIRDQQIHFFEGSYREYTQAEPQKDHDPLEDQLLMVDTKVSDVLSRLSLEPSEKLEEEFQRLLQEKNMLKQRLEKRQ